MLQPINKYLIESFEIQTSHSIDSILESVNKVVSDHDWIIKTNPPIIIGIEIQIQRTPSTFAPLRGLGTIKWTLSRISNLTTIKCEILPYNNAYHYILLIGIVGMALWTLVGLLPSASSERDAEALVDYSPFYIERPPTNARS